MGMVMFGTLFRDVANKETLEITVIDRPGIPQGKYGLIELFCVDQGCDCRRVILYVLSATTHEHLASINFAFDPDDDLRGPFLDHLNPQSEHSLALLDLVREVLEKDADYVKRLERHYHLVKAAVSDPEHPAQKRLPPGQTVGQEFTAFAMLAARQAATVGRNDACPCGAKGSNGKRKKFKTCCFLDPKRIGPPAEGRRQWAKN